MTRTLATFVQPGSYTGSGVGPGEILVGRKVANTSFIRALLRFGSFDRYCFLVGELADVESVKGLLQGLEQEIVERIVVRNLIELPEALANGEISVIHLNSHADQMGTVITLRDRYAGSAVPVTAQIHSLSYPSMMGSYLSTALAEPREIDAVFCSSEPGKEVVQRCFGALRERMAERGASLPEPRWRLPVVPLGISCAALRGGDGSAMRSALGIPESAFVVLSMARFTEYDKMDIFPLVTAFAGFVDAVRGEGREPWLVLAGARQGTRTPEMVGLWAKGLGLQDRFRLRVDFPEAEKSGLLAAADVFVAPSDNPQETFGISVVEAQAAGLPIIAADLDGYKDTVPEEVGIRVATHWTTNMDRVSEVGPMLYQRPLHLFLGQSIEVDLNQLAQAMATLYRDSDLRMAMGIAASQRADRLYDWARVIPRFEEVWAELSAGPFVQRPDASHPLQMDFQQVFGHYPTTVRNTHRAVRRSVLAEAACRTENNYPIYPEMKNVFDGDAVMAALGLAESPVMLGELERELVERVFRKAPWKASVLVGWLLKHGLLE